MFCKLFLFVSYLAYKNHIDIIMNCIFNVVFMLSTIILLLTNPSSVLSTVLGAGEKAVSLCLSLVAIYAIWLGLLNIVEQSGLNTKLAKLLSPLITFLYGNQPQDIKEQLCLNFSANILGMGNASTPSGIKAMQLLEQNKCDKKAMIMLVVINSMSIQLLPTTLIGMKIAHDSQNASDIILPIIITSFISTFVAICLVKIFYKDRRTKK